MGLVSHQIQPGVPLVSSQHIYDSAVSTQHLAAAVINSALLGNSAVSTQHIANSVVSTQHIANSVVSTQHIANSVVSTQHIANSVVSTQHIANSVVSSQHIANSVVSSQHMAAAAIKSGAISSGAVQPSHINYFAAVPLGFPKVSASNAVYTRDSAWSASSINSTVAPGTAIDFPRNLVARLTPSTGSSGLYSGGSIAFIGSDIQGNAITDTVAVTALNTVETGIALSKCFASLGTISFSNVTIHTASSSASNDMSLHVGVHQRIALPQSVQSSNAVVNAWLGTAIQNATMTVHTGAVPDAAIQISAYANNSALLVNMWLSR